MQVPQPIVPPWLFHSDETAGPGRTRPSVKEIVQWVCTRHRNATIETGAVIKSREVDASGFLAHTLGLPIWPAGRLLHLTGDADTAKTSYVLALIAIAQRAGKTCAYIDADGSLDARWSALLGVDNTELLYSAPSTAELVFETARSLCNIAQLIIIDTITALPDRIQLENESILLDGHKRASVLTHGVSMLLHAAFASNTCVVMTSQRRSAYSTCAIHQYRDVPAAPRALSHFASVEARMRMRSRSTCTFEVEVYKSKYGQLPPRSNVSFGAGGCLLLPRTDTQ
jgi:RecA/RadA recombinase